MSLKMEFEGLESIIRECENQFSQKEIDKVNRKILKKCAESSKSKVASRMPRSDDVSKSGRRGSRTYIHAADVIPMTGVRKKGDVRYILVGWDQGDNSPYFYVKFMEWGTSKRAPFPVFLPVAKSVAKELRGIGIEEYEALLKKVIK